MNGNISKLRQKLKAERFKLFTDVTAALPRPVRILDLGGTAAFWRSFVNGNPEDSYRVTLVNNHHIDPTQRKAEISVSWIAEKRIDAFDFDQWDLPGHDLIFSNSFLEHLETRGKQKQLARMMENSGKPYFLQVPNKLFPLDPHFPSPLVPFFALYPEPLQAALISRYRFGSGGRSSSFAAARTPLRFYTPVGVRDMADLFPGGIIKQEKTFGLCRSILVYRI